MFFMFKLYQNNISRINSFLEIGSFRNNTSKTYVSETSESFSLFNVKKHLKNQNIAFTDGHSCLKTACPICEPKIVDSRHYPNHVYINKITGAFVCSNCRILQSWDVTNNIIKTTKKSQEFIDVKKFVDRNQKNIQINFKEPDSTKSHKMSLKEIVSHLKLEMFPLEIFETFGVLCDSKNQTLYFPLKDDGGLVVGYKLLFRLQDQLTESTIPETNCFGVLSSELKQQKDNSAVIVLNIPDMLALCSQHLNTSIVCLPHSYKSLPQSCLPALERFSRLTLWFQNDIASWDTARNFSKKLNDKRCLVVRPTESHSSPFSAMQERQDIRAIIAQAQPVLNKAITTFASLRQDVLSEIQNIDKVQGVKWNRFPILNKLLKGHRKGELTILTGPTGCGKTTFMSEYSLDLSMQGVNTLWGSFEIRNTRLASTLLRQLAGHPFDEDIVAFNKWANEFEKLPMYFMTFHGQQSIKLVMDTIEHAQYIHDINHVIIDNVQFMMGTSDESRHIDRFWRQDAIVAAFRSFATKKNCHVTLVIHPRKEREAEDLTTNSIFGGAKATQEADNVLIIQDKRLTAVRGKKYLQISKNRYSGDLGIMPMDFDKSGLSYEQKKKKIEDVKATAQIPKCI